MLVEATVVLTDHDAEGADLSVLVEAEVVSAYLGQTRLGSKPRAVGVEWLDLTGGRPATRAGEGTQALRGRAQDLVDKQSNWWRVHEALAEAYDKAVKT